MCAKVGRAYKETDMSLNRILAIVGLICASLMLTACGPDYPNCENDGDCSGSEKGKAEGKLFCLNGLCQQCREDDHCGDPSLECNAGVCEQIPGYCSDASDCPGNQKCRENRCGPECESDDECADGQVCKGGVCEAESECSTDGDCADGEMCQNGQCVAASGNCSLQTVYFGYDDASVDSSARSTLQSNADCIKENNMKVRLAGHADERGTSEYNIALGERRANNARKYLEQLGVKDDSISTISYGEERLVRECGEEGPESCHRQNRRVEVDRR